MKTRGSREVYRNAWMTVREDAIERDDGGTGIYGVVDKPDFALVVPVDAGGFWLVEQYRYPIGRRAWEFPQGSWGPGASGTGAAGKGSDGNGSDGPGAARTPADLARAELAEETGLRAGRLRHVGHLFAAYGFCSQGFDVFLAGDLQPGPAAREESEQDMQMRHVTEAEFRSLITQGGIVDGATLAAYSLLLLERSAGNAG